MFTKPSKRPLTWDIVDYAAGFDDEKSAGKATVEKIEQGVIIEKTFTLPAKCVCVEILGFVFLFGIIG